MRNDIILITLDCWPYWALEEMKELASFADDNSYEKTESVCQGASTWFALPSINSSLYSSQAYTDTGELSDRVVTLAEVLSEEGYSTGAFIGANPYANLWTRGFDTFWNGGLEPGSEPNLFDKLMNDYNGYRLKYLALQERVSISDVLKRSKAWYRDQESPRFLWVHLMDTHEPYLPGLLDGFDIGLTRVYRALYEHKSKRGKDMSEESLTTHRELYRKVLRNIEPNLVEFLREFNENSTVLITGDHGQEIEDGMHAHARMLDSVIKVPFLCRWMLDTPLEYPDSPVRQIDIAPTIVEGVGSPVPDEWEGAPIDGTNRDSFTIGDYEYFDSVYVAVRTEKYKMIKTFDYDTKNLREIEVYDISSDPSEENNIYSEMNEDELSILEDKLDEFLDRRDIRKEIYTYPPNSEVSDKTEVAKDRLRELGYIE